MKSPATSRLFGAVLLLSSLARPAAGAGLSETFLELLDLYARGHRPRAIAGLSALSDRDLERQLQAATALERCASCIKQTPGQLRAAVMLHADTDRASAPVSNEVEQPRQCPGRLATLAGRYATLLALRPEAGDFAPRFFLYMALRCQWDACLEEGLKWARDGIALFPRDPRLLLVAGSILDENAVLGGGSVNTISAPGSLNQRAMMLAQARDLKKRDMFLEAKRFYESTLKIDAERDLARLRLGIVSWRLRDLGAARAALREASERSSDAKLLYLAHLFLGRVHEDAGRVEDADDDYRKALALDPGAQAAAIALSHLRRLQGAGEASRQLLVSALSRAPRRQQRDAYWDYLGGSSEQLESLLAGLHRESESE